MNSISCIFIKNPQQVACLGKGAALDRSAVTRKERAAVFFGINIETGDTILALGAKNLASFNEKRIRNGSRFRMVWMHAPKKGEAHIWKGGDVGIERRFSPAGFSPKMEYTVYDDKALFVNSAAESFDFVVHSADFAELISLQFDLLWNENKRKN